MDRDLGKPTTGRSATETCTRLGQVDQDDRCRQAAGLPMQQKCGGAVTRRDLQRGSVQGARQQAHSSRSSTGEH